MNEHFCREEFMESSSGGKKRVGAPDIQQAREQPDVLFSMDGLGLCLLL